LIQPSLGACGSCIALAGAMRCALGKMYFTAV